MDSTDDQLEESLAFMREQFKPLTRSIPIPDTLHASLLRERLDILMQEQAATPNPKGKLVRFPWKPIMSVAACLVIAVGSYSVYEQSNKMTPQLMTTDAAESVATDAPSLAAMPALLSEEAGQPVADLPMSAAAFAAPVPNGAISDGAVSDGAVSDGAISDGAVADLPMEAPAAPIPENSTASEISPKLRGAIGQNESTPKDQPFVCRSIAPQERYTTLTDAQNAPLGGYLPDTAPANTQMTDAFLDASHLVCIMQGSDPTTGNPRELVVTVSTFTSAQESHIVSPSDPSRYDLRLYAMPWADSIPQDLQWITDDVIFRAAELTPALIEARIVTADADQGDLPKAIGRFSVLFEDQTVVRYHSTNLTPQEIMNLISKQ